jgi:deazaflavin-dependent oxidoreductase (nitroreductase family)
LLASSSSAQFLYLSTLGWKSVKRHKIEIWFVEHEGRYYVVSERYDRAHWVQNVIHDPKVTFDVSGKAFEGRARIVQPDRESTLASKVAGLMEGKYGWSDGLIVELNPEVAEK